ncbi:MAG TPA: Gfo/Idh/MocA family oxidoreductase [Candidatus Methylacidiphilales bacterium]|jgi:predicted dehydrogenase|nr:Gfo/Idh/MocA family oxidoreductase [Candidatus Methylacidiphilales bacterium]
MEKLKLIQCGVGGFGKSWLTDVAVSSPDFELAAIVDVVDANLAAAGDAAKIPAGRRFPTLEAALEKVQADAVLTVTPPAVHVQHARVAFARGLHLMTEKPIAGTIEEAREMVKLAKDANRRLLVSQNYRYNAPYAHARTLLDEGVAGQLGSGHLSFYIPSDFRKTFRETMEFPLLVDMAIHHLDLIRFITRKNIRKVTALTFNPPGSTFQHDAGLKMLLELEDGLAFSYDGDWSALGRTTPWSGNWRLQGSQGSLHLEGDKIILARSEFWGKNPSEETVSAPALEFSARAATLHEFAATIRSGGSSELEGASNLWSFGAVIAGVESCRTGRTVDVAGMLGQA